MKGSSRQISVSRRGGCVLNRENLQGGDYTKGRSNMDKQYALADLLFSELLSREAELAASAEAEADAGFPGQKESELAVVRALIRLILSPDVRMPRERLQ
jgi:hypothetical protein